MKVHIKSQYTLTDLDGDPINLEDYPKDIEDFIKKQHHKFLQDCQNYINNRTDPGDANSAYDSAMGII